MIEATPDALTEGPSMIDLCRAVAAGQVAARKPIGDSFERARALQPEILAFAFLPDGVPAAGNGPLAGAAVAVKDLFDTADMPTAYGTAVLRAHRPAADAAIVVRLRSAGASVLGKTVTTEFAYRQPGPTRNPWNHLHTPGGSSSGSAAAVAAGIAPLALGTQTMGSVIRPAAFCGVVGFKPTFGTLPREGVHPLCDALDHVGLFARTVADVRFALSRLGIFADGIAADTPRPLRLGLLPLNDATISGAQHEAMRRAVAKLRAAGHVVANAADPSGLSDVTAVVDTLMAFEAVRHFGPLVARHGEAIGAPIRELVARGQSVGAAAYQDALAAQTAFRDAQARAVEPYDALLTIPAAGEAPVGLSWTGDPRFCTPWSLAGVPALTVPIGFGPAGLPLGLQLVGRWGEDAALLEAGGAVADVVRS